MKPDNSYAFPSPFGVYGFSIGCSIRNTTMLHLVSVPFRGLWFLNKEVKKCIVLIPRLVSVPFRGLWFLNVFNGSNGHIGRKVSVPFRGLWFLNSAIFIAVPSFSLVSVPFRGLWFLNTPEEQDERVLLCFRPLSGFMVSQCHILMSISWGGCVSVPFRGLWFLNENSRG